MVWPAIIGAVAQIAGAGISAAASSKNASKAAKAAAGKTPLQIRNEALQAGFNPVTVLTNGALQQPAGYPLPSLSGLDVLGPALSAVGQAFSNYDPVAEETRELENKLLRQQIDLAEEKLIAERLQTQTAPFQNAVPRTRVEPQSPQVRRQPKIPAVAARNAPAPKARPADGEEFNFPVFTPDGSRLIYIPESWAKRSKVEPWQNLMAGDYEEMLGELGGELFMAPQLPALVKRSVGGGPDTWSPPAWATPKYSSDPNRAKSIRNPAPGWMSEKFGPMRIE